MILAASSDLFSGQQTGSILHYFLHGLSPEAFAAVHFTIRKLSHLVEYAILATLAWRAAERHRAVVAIGVVLAVAIVDELHQSTIPSRSGSAVDVLIDCAGAVIAVLILRGLRGPATTVPRP